MCDKPLVINRWNLDVLEEFEKEVGRKVNTVLQLRVHPSLLALKKRLADNSDKRHPSRMTYITSRGM